MSARRRLIVRRSHAEDDAQRAVIRWASYQWLPDAPDPEAAHLADYLLHVPNGGSRGRTEAARMVGLGVKKGVSDLLLTLRRSGYAGLWIELKKPRHLFPSTARARAAVSQEQRAWLQRMAAAGFATAVCYGSGEAIETITAYLEGRWQQREVA